MRKDKVVMLVYSETAVNSVRRILKITTLRGLQWHNFTPGFMKTGQFIQEFKQQKYSVVTS
jgi:hypothetical protein